MHLRWKTNGAYFAHFWHKLRKKRIFTEFASKMRASVCSIEGFIVEINVISY